MCFWPASLISFKFLSILTVTEFKQRHLSEKENSDKDDWIQHFTGFIQTYRQAKWKLKELGPFTWFWYWFVLNNNT